MSYEILEHKEILQTIKGAGRPPADLRVIIIHIFVIKHLTQNPKWKQVM